MNIGIMQPYFFPYLGYWQLINHVDKFVVYDNIQFEKSGWMRRNRILVNGSDKMISLSIKKASDYLDVRDRQLASNHNEIVKKHLNLISQVYKKAPHFEETMSLIEGIMLKEETNLFGYLFYSIKVLAGYLEINTPIVVSSTIEMDHNLKGKERVMELCRKMDADVYTNPIGGVELYDKNEFLEHGIKLSFIESRLPAYRQFQDSFVAGLSIIDILMFNSVEEIKTMLNEYDLR